MTAYVDMDCTLMHSNAYQAFVELLVLTEDIAIQRPLLSP